MNLPSYMDHTYLKPGATSFQIKNLALEALEWNFASVCIHAHWLPLAAEILKGSPVKLCTVIGFPLGLVSASVKAFEAEEAVRAGAQELDMVIHLDKVKSKDWKGVEEDIRRVVDAGAGNCVKVILETCYLTLDEIVDACKASVQAGAAFVKTSTGFGPVGATVEHVKLMRQTVGPGIGVKASGGIRTLSEALDMIKAGASRLGTSASVSLAQDFLRSGS